MTPLLLIPDPQWISDFDEMEAQLGEFAELGLSFEIQPWTHPIAAKPGQLVLALMAWGYHQRVPQWQAALDAWEGLTLANPLAVLRWNWDKVYLLDLQAKGVALVPTRMSDGLTELDLAEARAAFGTRNLVIKPPVSGGADGTHLLTNAASAPHSAFGKRMIIQPAMPAITSEGEFSLFYFGGRFSHAILKTPQNGDFRVQSQFGGVAQAVAPPPAALALAETALAAAPGPVAYARVDMVRDGDGFALMELELIEPWLALGYAADKGGAFADMIRGLTAR